MRKSCGAFAGGFLEVWFWLFVIMGIATNGIFLLYAIIILIVQFGIGGKPYGKPTD
jgi:hypothetical protein